MCARDPPLPGCWMMEPCAAKTCLAKADPDAEFIDDWDIVRDDIAPSEFEKLRSLREALRSLDDHPACRTVPRCANPYVLLRQLRSSGGVEKAARFIGGSHLDWCQRVDLDASLKAWREEYARGRTRRARVMREYMSLEESCPDKYGVPILLCRAGVLDTAGVLREAGPHAILMHWMHFTERASEHLTQACRRHRKVVPGQLWLADLDNNPHVPDWSTRLSFGAYGLVGILKDLKYPVVLRKVIAIRTGFFVQSLWWGVVHPILKSVSSGAALSNVHVCGSCVSSWKEQLCAEVDENSPAVPAFLFSDSAEACAAATPAGGLIPEATEADMAIERVGEEDSSDDAADNDITITAVPSSGGPSLCGNDESVGADFEDDASDVGTNARGEGGPAAASADGAARLEEAPSGDAAGRTVAPRSTCKAPVARLRDLVYSLCHC